MNNKWQIIDAVVGVIGGIASVVGIFTAIKAEGEDRNDWAKFEERYGIKPVNDESKSN